MSDCAAGHAKPRYLPRLTIDSLTYHHPKSSLSSMTSSSYSTRASIASSLSSSSSSSDGFFVYCVHDFEAADADQLSFRSTEILEVVRQEDSGWWAAIRDGEYKVGWIPSAFVEPISDEEAYTLREAQSLHEVYEDDIKQLDDSFYRQTHPYSANSPPEGVFQWTPGLGTISSKPLPPTPQDPDTPTDIGTPLSSPFSPALPTSQSPGQEITFYPHKMRTKKAVPPSPSTPVPQPPPKTAPLPPAEGARICVRRSFSLPSPAVQQKTSPCSASSDPGNSPYRSTRRRPVLIDDSLSLKRLSVLLEAQDAEEAEQYLHSPDMTEAISVSSQSLSSGSRSSSEKVRQITGDEQAQILHAARIAESTSPWYMRPAHGEDEIQLEYDGRIVAGTLPAIVERLILYPFNALLDFKFRRTFFISFRTLSTADRIYDLLLEQYNMSEPHGLSPLEVTEWRAKRLLPAQRRVLLMLKTWLVDHAMIEDDPPIAARLQIFLETIKAPSENAALAREVMTTLERLTFTVPTTPVPVPELSTKPHKRKKTRTDSKNELWKTDPGVLAEHLCIHEHKYYAKIRAQECLDWVKSKERTGNLLAFCSLHDQLASWVKQSILWTDNLGKRADMIDFWIKAAEKCRSMHNFSSMSAIVTALTSRVISKLYLTWAHVGPARRQTHLDPLAQLNEPAGGFAAFRQAQQALENDGTPCVPFVGMYLTDIVHINDKYQDKDVFLTCKAPGESTDVSQQHTERYFSFVKRRKWSEVIDEMLAFQKNPYPYTQDPIVAHLIEANFQHNPDKEQTAFWEKSEQVLKQEVESADIRKGLKDAGF